MRRVIAILFCTAFLLVIGATAPAAAQSNIIATETSVSVYDFTTGESIVGAIRDTKRATIMSNTVGYERRITGRVRLGFGLTVPAVVNFDKAFNPVAVPLPMPSLRGGIDLVHGFALGARVMTPMRVDSNGDGTYDSPLLFPWHLMVDYRIPLTPVSLSIGFHGLLNDRHFAAQKLPLAASIGTAWSF